MFSPANRTPCNRPLVHTWARPIPPHTPSLVKFPGPKLSTFTGWYKAYIDVLGGPRNTFSYEIQRMHEKYDSIVRINPHELHVSDYDFFDTLFAGGASKRDRVFGTVSHDAHRKRRAAISSFFSKKSVASNEPLIHAKVELLCDVFEDAMHKGELVNIREPLLAYTTDFYCAHALGDSGYMNLLKDMEKAQTWRESITGLLHLTLANCAPVSLDRAHRRRITYGAHQVGLVRHGPCASDPPGKFAKTIPLLHFSVLTSIQDMQEQAEAAIQEFEKVSDTKLEEGHVNLMQAKVRSRLPPWEKTRNRIAKEAFSVLTASGDTIARNLTTAVYHLLAKPHLLSRPR